MAKKDFIKEKVFDSKTVEDIFQEVYLNYSDTQSVLNEYISTALVAIGGDMDKLLLFTQNIKGLIDASVKNSDTILKLVETLRRSIMEQKENPDNPNNKSLESSLADLRKSVMTNKKNIGQA